MVIVDKQAVCIGDVYKRKNWRHNVKWRVEVIDIQDDLLAYRTIEYTGKSDDLHEPTTHITLIRSFLEKFERD